MKVKIGILLTCLVSFSAWGNHFVREVPQPLARVFVPHGFDTNDSVEIVVAGVLKSSCSRVGRVSTELDEARKLISVTLSSYEYSGTCLKTDIPFYLTVHVGLLRASGYYTIADEVSHRALAKMAISQAPGSGGGIDSSIYPPLTDAYLLKQLGRDVIVLKGFMPMDCLTVDVVDVRVQPDVVVALPHLAKLPGQACKKGNFPFTKTVVVSKALPRGLFLLHVRSMGGRAINKIVAGT